MYAESVGLQKCGLLAHPVFGIFLLHFCLSLVNMMVLKMMGVARCNDT